MVGRTTTGVRTGGGPTGRAALGAACLVAGWLIAVPARADDWPQFRRDARRTGASSDAVRLPLTQVWDSQAGGGRLLSHGAAVWHGRVFYTDDEGGRRALVCADARTGVPLWRQP